MFRPGTLVCAVLAACLAGGAAAQSPAPSSAAEGTSERVPAADRAFMHDAAQAGQARVQASRLALSKSTDAHVKDFAQRLVDEQSQANAQLRRMARAKGVDVPAEASFAQKIKLQLLEFAQGADFDQRYADDFGVQAHRETIELYEQAVADGRDPEVKAYANELLPQLQQQLEAAQALRAGVDPGR